MGIISYNEVKPRSYIILQDDPYECLESHVFRKQQRKPVNQTKLKNLITGKVVEHSFGVSDKVEEAEMSSKDVTFAYQKYNRDTGTEDYWFTDPHDKSQRFNLSASLLDDAKNFIKEGQTITLITFAEQPIGVKFTTKKMPFKVTEAPPNVKGNTAQGGNKQVTIETGASITTPMFIEVGDTILVNVETGEYAGRE